MLANRARGHRSYYDTAESPFKKSERHCYAFHLLAISRAPLASSNMLTSILPRLARTLSMLTVLGSVLAADETMKHYHRGKLPKYELSAPSIMLSAGDEEVLNKGKALMQVIVQADGKRRLLMVRDVATPAWVVMERILDFPAYPRMVKGCDAMVPYHDKREVRALTPG